MGIKHWTDLPAGSNETHINPRSGLSSSRENCEAMTLASCETIPSLNDLYAQGKGECHVSNGAGKKARIVGWGLRKFSRIVCAKVQAKGRTTYNQVADEIVTEFRDAPPEFPFDEKNIRRRVYDAINVLMAINLIEKDKKEIRWIGCPTTKKTEELKQLKEADMNQMNRIQAKANFLKELEEKFVDLQNLVLRNKQARKMGNLSSKGVPLPFLLVQTHSQATVEIEISEDMRLVHFDFNGTPFTLNDGAAILRAKRCPQAELATRSSSEGSTPITDLSGKPVEPTSFSWNSEDLNL